LEVSTKASSRARARLIRLITVPQHLGRLGVGQAGRVDQADDLLVFGAQPRHGLFYVQYIDQTFITPPIFHRRHVFVFGLRVEQRVGQSATAQMVAEGVAQDHEQLGPIRRFIFRHGLGRQGLERAKLDQLLGQFFLAGEAEGIAVKPGEIGFHAPRTRP